MKKYTLKVTEAQLRCIANATNLLQRVQLGQWREIVDNLPLRNNINYNQLHDDLREFSKVLSRYTIDNIDGIYSSLGIGNPNLPETNGVLYDVRRAIEHKLAMESAVEKGIIESEDSPRKWPEMMTVDYDPPMKWGNEPLIKIERVSK
jgi:hypothetical protein